jgi:hypothetical protein
MNTKLPNKGVADLLAPHSPEVRNLALPVRGFVFPTMPDISEQVDAEAANHRLRLWSEVRRHGLHAHAHEGSGEFRHCLRNGTARSGKTSEGTGKFHRHVKLESKADLQSAALKSLLSAAIARREEPPEVKEIRVRRTA